MPLRSIIKYQHYKPLLKSISAPLNSYILIFITIQQPAQKLSERLNNVANIHTSIYPYYIHSDIHMCQPKVKK